MARLKAYKRVPNPWQRVRRVALVAQLLALLVTTSAALVVAASVAPAGGKDFLGGGVIAGVPQWWFLVRASADRAGSQAGLLTLGKMALSAAGFALWFGLRPDANPVTTLFGTATYIGVATVGLVIGSRRT
jgi:F0F1-type ATP synthase assembly protein I